MNEKYLSEGKELSASELLDLAGVNYVEVVEGELYKIYHAKNVYQRMENREQEKA